MHSCPYRVFCASYLEQIAARPTFAAKASEILAQELGCFALTASACQRYPQHFHIVIEAAEGTCPRVVAQEPFQITLGNGLRLGELLMSNAVKM
jgi:hypothetical protein